MANEFKHKDPCTTLTQAEYIAACGDGHIFACQATGDIAYASSATVLSKLAKGAANTVLHMGGSCIPAWTASPSVTDLTISGGCITLTGAATDIDLIDNNASALSFDASGKAGIIDIVTTNCSEGVTMSGTLGVTGVLTATGGLAGGAICIGSSTITTTGLISGGSLDIDNVLINGTTIGHTCDTDLITIGDQSVTIAGDLAISGGCITLTGAATDVDLIDNNACALSFDASGQAGILAIDTQNCAEGVKMSAKLGVTGVLTATGGIELSHATANTLTASSGVLSIEGNRVFHAGGTDIPVADGGTGASTFTANGILVGNGTSAVAVTATMATKGHVMIGDGSGVPSMLAVGNNCLVLTACSSEATGVKWAAAGGGVGCGPLRISGGAACAPAYSVSGDTNTGMWFPGADIVELIAGGGGNIRINSSALVFIHDCANGNMGRGLTIDQGGYDNEIIALKSCDVVHDFTGETEADTYGFIQKTHATAGGLAIHGFGVGAVVGLDLHGAGEEAIGCNATGASGSINLNAHDDGGAACYNAIGCTANMVAFRNDGTTYALVKGNGDLHTATGSITDEWDAYCDVALLTAARGIMASCKSPDFKRSLRGFVDEYACVLEQSGVVSLNRDTDSVPFMSHNAMFGLIIDTIRQVGDRVVSLETELKALTEGK